MKKIIKLSLLFIGAFFLAGKINAQVASDKPAPTAAQMDQLLKSRQPVQAKVVTTQTVSSSKPAVVSDQGGVKPAPIVISEVKQPVEAEKIEAKPLPEVKIPQVPMQSAQKPKS